MKPAKSSRRHDGTGAAIAEPLIMLKENASTPKPDPNALKEANKRAEGVITINLKDFQNFYAKNSNIFLIILAPFLLMAFLELVTGDPLAGFFIEIDYVFIDWFAILFPFLAFGVYIRWKLHNIQPALKHLKPVLQQALGIYLCKKDEDALSASAGLYGPGTRADPKASLKHPKYTLSSGRTWQKVDESENTDFGFDAVILDLPPINGVFSSVMIGSDLTEYEEEYFYGAKKDAPEKRSPFFMTFNCCHGPKETLSRILTPDIQAHLLNLRSEYKNLGLVFTRNCTLIVYEQAVSLDVLTDESEPKKDLISQYIAILDKAEHLMLSLGFLEPEDCIRPNNR